jgi:hypothetical protein
MTLMVGARWWPRRGRRELEWLSLTPEPERELPEAMAWLRAGGGPPQAEAVGAERARVEAIVLRGEERDGLAYLAEAVALLLDPRCDGLTPDRRRAVLEVLANHHRLLLGLPGDAADRTDAARRRLESALTAPAPTNGTP